MLGVYTAIRHKWNVRPCNRSFLYLMNVAVHSPFHEKKLLMLRLIYVNMLTHCSRSLDPKTKSLVNWAILQIRFYKKMELIDKKYMIDLESKLTHREEALWQSILKDLEWSDSPSLYYDSDFNYEKKAMERAIFVTGFNEKQLIFARRQNQNIKNDGRNSKLDIELSVSKKWHRTKNPSAWS